MMNTVLANFYERDLRKLIEEINLFRNENNLWRIAGSVKNSSGNLALHIIGGLNHLVGATLAQTGYIRNRDHEFTRKGVSKEELIGGLEELITLMQETLSAFTPEKMEAEYTRAVGLTVSLGILRKNGIPEDAALCKTLAIGAEKLYEKCSPHAQAPLKKKIKRIRAEIRDLKKMFKGKL